MIPTRGNVPQPMSESSAKPDPYAPWRSADYRRYAGSWFLIVFSRRIEVPVLSFYVVATSSRAQSPFLLALLALVQALPVMMLFIPGGQLADRFDRRLVMVLSYSLGVASSGGILAVALLHGSIAWIYVLLAAGAVGWALGNPARQAVLPHLVPTELFSNAVAWNSSAFYVASVTGPIAGGFILDQFAGHGLALSFVVVLLCRLVAVAAMTMIPPQPVNRAEQSVSWESVVAGIRFVWRTKLILATITLDLFAVLLGGATYLLPIYAKDILHVGARGFGFLQSADAIGAICMLLFLVHRPPLKRPGVTLLWAVAGFGAATAVFGFSRWYWLSLSMMFLIGAFDNISVVVRHTLVQMLTPDEMRGRVSAVNGVFIVASNDLGGLESGLTAGLFGPVASVVGGGIGAILVVLGVGRLWPQLLKIGPLDSIQPASPAETDREA
jgi:MFS family permease